MIRLWLIGLLVGISACAPGGNACVVYEPVYLKSAAAEALVAMDREAAVQIDTNNRAWEEVCK